MARPFRELPQIMRKREREFLLGVNRLSRDGAKVAGETAVDTTRVDTGLARSNWGATIGVPSAAIRPAYAPGAKLGTGEQGNRLGAIAQHSLVIATWNALKGPMFITNNLPYIGFLNFGGRNVSPGNMLALAGQAWKLHIKTNFRKILK